MKPLNKSNLSYFDKQAKEIDAICNEKNSKINEKLEKLKTNGEQSALALFFLVTNDQDFIEVVGGEKKLSSVNKVMEYRDQLG